MNNVTKYFMAAIAIAATGCAQMPDSDPGQREARRAAATAVQPLAATGIAGSPVGASVVSTSILSQQAQGASGLPAGQSSLDCDQGKGGAQCAVLAHPKLRRQAANSRAHDAYIVVLNDGASLERSMNLLKAFSGASVNAVYRHALHGFSAGLPLNALAVLLKDADVLYIEEDGYTSAVAETVPAGVFRIDGEPGRTSGNGAGVTVAVIDTGIDYNHADLTAGVTDHVDCILGNSNCMRTTKSACDHAGTNGLDNNGHGTHVAGTIAARANSGDVVGVAPGANLVAVKVLGADGNGCNSWVVAGIDYVAGQGATKIQVANMSLGGGISSATDSAVRRAVDANITMVVAAGNSGADTINTSPGREEKAITVSALADSDGQPGGFGAATGYGPDDSFASFSNYGNPIDVIAPGVAILSTCMGGGTCIKSGTSMATPSVAGVVALYLQQHPGTAPAAVSLALQSLGTCPNGAEPALDVVFGKYVCPTKWLNDKDAHNEPLVSAVRVSPPCTVNSDCDDSNSCTGVETCVDYTCVAGTPVVCNDNDACTSDSCNPATGCAFAPITCDDSDACNGIETCSTATGCVAGTPVTCDADLDLCTVEYCSAGLCASTPMNCDDGDACTGTESCDSAAGCVAGTEVTCDDADACTTNSCDPANGTCAFPATACNDGNACNGAESCDPATGCTVGTPLTCDDADLCNGSESCDPAAGCVAGTALTCADGNACNGTETCVAATGCSAGTPLTCNDGNSCTNDSCNPVTGQCVFASNGTCCSAVAVSCTSNAQCCSGNCAGKTGKKVCK